MPRPIVVVATPFAARMHPRTRSVSIGVPRLIERLAGGRGAIAHAGQIRAALADFPSERFAALTDLAAIADRAGFLPALARTIERAWWAGLDLAALAARPGAHPRFADLALLSAWIGERLPSRVVPPAVAVAAAHARLRAAPAVILDGVADLPLLVRPLIEALAATASLTWRSPYPKHLHPFTPAGATMLHPSAATDPASIRAASYPDPTEEIDAALRWAEQRLEAGIAPREVAIAALDPAGYDATFASLAAGFPLHFTDGFPLLVTPIGQLLAAWSEAARPGRLRLARLIAAVHALADDGVAVPDAWAAIPRDWERDLAGQPNLANPAGWEAPPELEPLRTLALRLAADPFDPATVATYLPTDAIAIWSRFDAGSVASDAAWASVRLPDPSDPTDRVAWGSAATLLGALRPHRRLLGVASGDWPRPNRDDPLLPRHLLGSQLLDGRRRGRIDRDDFLALGAGAASLTLSVPRRGDDGRERLPSPLLLPFAPIEASDAPAPTIAGDAATESEPAAAFAATDLTAEAAVAAAVAAHRARLRAELTAYDALLPARHPQLIAALQRPLSASALDTLLRDPFEFFAERVLGWREPPSDDEPLRLGTAALGSLIHALIERTAAWLGADVAEPPAERVAEFAGALARATAEIEARQRALRPPPSEALWAADLTIATNAVRAAFAAAPLGPDTAFELRFGEPSSRAARLQGRWRGWRIVRLPGTKLRLHGVIDRLDRLPDGSLLVTDFKTGASASEAKLRDEVELQRALYAVAVRALGGSDTPITAQLHYLRHGTLRPLSGSDLEERIAVVTIAIIAAVRAFTAGVATPAVSGRADRHPLALAHPADAHYRERKRAAREARAAGR
jgi:RecB family exonuclease